jgi:hypothetical protein
MTRIAQAIGQSPFNPIKSFTALVCGAERITMKDPAMKDLQLALDCSRKLHETLAYAKGAQMSGGDPAPILADAASRLADVSNALGYFADPIEEPTDDVAMAAVEGVDVEVMRAAE